MKIQKIAFTSNPQTTYTEPKSSASKEITAEKSTENKNHTTRNWAIGLGIAATLIGLGVLAKKGHLNNVLKHGEKNADNIVDDVIDRGGRVSDDIPVYNRGSYGQDIMDPSNPLNYQDMMSPYYNPMVDPLNPMNPMNHFGL